ncbi:unnamed protein product [Cuscuta europaea]|uniref:Cyclin-like domain-containing protein n=1 Tax=Cuscuta europaea TaxID=41803 RepID=A0A9P0YW22_CUSEU|nr:unnamed protein product [Cuscuta europaea]
MMWCDNCGENVHTDNSDGRKCCTLCGRVLSEDHFADEPTFVKNAAGQSQLAGSFVRSVQSQFSASRDRTLKEAYEGMDNILYALGIDGGDSIVDPALRIYTIALDRNFTRGRRKEQVQAACLYISCRKKKKPFLLIDFSEYLRINVYVLGAVFLQLCKLLSLEEHPIVQTPVDPSLFIHRFTDRLFGEMNPDVSRTALRIVASMKRDWMQTGRKPSGLCGAALYIAALSYGLKCSKLDIIRVVHICEATLTKRLIEFENTDSGSLTIEEFNVRAVELEKEQRLVAAQYSVSKESGKSELLCEHKGSGIPHFSHGLCESCFTDFVTLSGGFDGGSEPPAFQRAKKERLMAKRADGDNCEDSNPLMSSKAENNGKDLHYRMQSTEGPIQNVDGIETLQGKEPELIDVASTSEAMQDGPSDKLHGVDGISSEGSDESDTFSDIDDVEVDTYLHNPEEKRLKKIIWEEMNREYLEEQAAKEAAALAAKKAFESSFTNPEEMEAAQKLAAAAAAAVAKTKKEKQQQRAAELKNSGPAKTAAEATQNMLSKRKRSLLVNFDVLESLFDETPLPDNNNFKKSLNDDISSNNDGYVDGITEETGEDWMDEREYVNEENYAEPETYDYEEQYNFEDY